MSNHLANSNILPFEHQFVEPPKPFINFYILGEFLRTFGFEFRIGKKRSTLYKLPPGDTKKYN